MSTNRMTQLMAVSLLAVLTVLSGASQANEWHAGVRYAGDRVRHDQGHRGDDRGGIWGGLDSIDERQERQRMAIKHGLRSGSITRQEAEYLWHEQQAIERMERRFESDGQLTQRERARLQRELDQAHQNIRYQAHDDDRWPRYGHGDWR